MSTAFCAIDVLGNRLGLIRAPAGTDLARVARNVVRREAGASDVADGVAAFACAQGQVEFAFCNPDGSPERFCGNALLGLTSLLRPSPELALRVHDQAGIARSVELHYRPGEASLLVGLDALPATTIETEVGPGVVLDVGTPHIVVRTEAVGLLDAARIWAVVERENKNLTLYEGGDGQLRACTFERGLTHMTAACGSGAIAAGVANAMGSAGGWSIRFPGGAYGFELRLAGRSMRVCLSIENAAVTVGRGCFEASSTSA